MLQTKISAFRKDRKDKRYENIYLKLIATKQLLTHPPPLAEFLQFLGNMKLVIINQKCGTRNRTPHHAGANHRPRQLK